MPKGQRRPDKPKIKVVDNHPNLVFSESLGRFDGFYKTTIMEALQGDRLINILKADKYALQQFKTAAGKLKLKLVFAVDGDNLYIKPISISEDVKKMYLVLREWRTMVDLETRARDWELNLKAEISKAIKDKLVYTKGSGLELQYKLTEKGMQAL